MVKRVIKEFVKNNTAYKEIRIYIFNFLIFSEIQSSTNTAIVNSLTYVKPTKIKGFKNETEN